MVAKKTTPGHDVFRALGDPTRRAILLLIAAGSMTPGAVAAHFNTSRQAVSKHIHILADSGLLKPDRHGRLIRYSLNPDRMNEVDGWLQAMKARWEDRFGQLDELLDKTEKRKQR